jgi:DNA-binding winged helix-turn-helix (wHTH) protein
VTTVEPLLDEYGLLWVGTAWVALTTIQESLLRYLIERRGSVVSRASLTEAVWPGCSAARQLDVPMARLRRRIAPLGLRIVTIRGRGFMLLESEPP